MSNQTTDAQASQTPRDYYKSCKAPIEKPCDLDCSNCEFFQPDAQSSQTPRYDHCSVCGKATDRQSGPHEIYYYCKNCEEITVTPRLQPEYHHCPLCGKHTAPQTGIFSTDYHCANCEITISVPKDGGNTLFVDTAVKNG